MPTRRISATTLVLLIAFAVGAAADPVTVTSGVVNLGGFGRGHFNSVTLSLNTDDGVFVTGSQGDGAFEQSLPPCTFVPCASGATTSGTQQFSFVDALGSTTIGATRFQTLTSGLLQFRRRSGHDSRQLCRDIAAGMLRSRLAAASTSTSSTLRATTSRR